MPVQDFLFFANNSRLGRTPNVSIAVAGGGVEMAGTPQNSSMQQGIEMTNVAAIDWSITGINDFWFHCEWDPSTGGGTPPAENGIKFMNGSTELFRLTVTSSLTEMEFQYHNGSMWVTIGSAITNPAPNGINSINVDVQINIADAGGYARLYLNRSSTAAAELTGDTLFRGLSTVDVIRLGGTSVSGSGSSSRTFFYEPLIADEDTRDFICEWSSTSSQGTRADWNGTESNIDNIQGDRDADADLVAADATDEITTYNMAAHDAALDVGHTIVTVAQIFLARQTVANGLDLQPAVYKTAMDYNLSTMPLGNDWEYYISYWDTDPSTASAWADQSAVEAAEFGMKAVT